MHTLDICNHTPMCGHCMNRAVLLYGLALDVQNHPNLVSDLGNNTMKKQVAWGGIGNWKAKQSLPQNPTPTLVRPFIVGVGRVDDPAWHWWASEQAGVGFSSAYP